jgi:hypothetical protein
MQHPQILPAKSWVEKLIRGRFCADFEPQKKQNRLCPTIAREIILFDFFWILLIPNTLPMPRRSEFLETRTLAKFQELATDELRRTFANALKLSMRLDMNGNNFPRPADVSDLQRKYGLTLDVQRSFLLVINKQLAKKFLVDLNFPVRSNFDKIFDIPAYRARFDREPAMVGKRQMVLTYAEWLHFVRYEFEPEFPEFLESYLASSD